MFKRIKKYIITESDNSDNEQEQITNKSKKKYF